MAAQPRRSAERGRGPGGPGGPGPALVLLLSALSARLGNEDVVFPPGVVGLFTMFMPMGSMYGPSASMNGVNIDGKCLNVTPLIWHTYGSVMGWILKHH